MKRLLTFLVLILSALPSLGATTTIGQLPLLDPSSTNAYWEVEDQSATPRSRKVPIGTVPQLTVYGVPGGSNYIGGTLDVLTNINVRPIGANGTNGTYSILYHPSFTVANLFTPPASSFPVVYCSDAVTSRGTGAYVRWDPATSTWLTWENVVATATVDQFILNARASGLIANSPISAIAMNPLNYQLGGIIKRNLNNSGTASSAGGVGASVLGSYTGFTTGTDTGGAARGAGDTQPALVAGGYISSGAMYSVSALCDGTDTYSCWVGLMNSNATNWTTEGCVFLYDRYGLLQTTIGSLNYTNVATSSSNNWIAVSVRASSYSAQDTGLAVKTGTTTADNLVIVADTTSVRFYTNGVLSVTMNTAAKVPNSTLSINNVVMLKNRGGTSRSLYEWAPGYNVRNAARSW